MSLPNDIARCTSETCPVRHGCQRWMFREDPNARVFFDGCKYQEHYISGLLVLLGRCDGWMVDAVKAPDFDNAWRVHDWRNHVPDALRKLWPALSEETRIVLVAMANDVAGNEKWD